jgi:carbon storage regulator CsrA
MYQRRQQPQHKWILHMLVLTRGIGEAIMIGKDIRVVLVSIEGNWCKIGIDAPPSTVILRTELVGKEPKKRQ